MKQAETEFDAFIIGGGIAGLCMYFQLSSIGKKVLLFDPNINRSASAMASGIINPITGRNFVKSWNIELLLNYALEFYPKLEEWLNTDVMQSRRIYRQITTILQENDIAARLLDDDYQVYMHRKITDEIPYIRPFRELKYCEINGGLQIWTSRLFSAFEEKLLSEKNLVKDLFEMSELHYNGIDYTYKEWKVKDIIFCQGHQSFSNQLTKIYPIIPNKGEALIVYAPLLNVTNLVKLNNYIVPLGNHLFWIGSNYHAGKTDYNPTDDFKEKTIKELDEMLTVPYRIIEHKVGVRPTSKDRKPILGKIGNEPGLWIFNGLGTKGFSLAPYYSQILMKSIYYNVSLSKEIASNRFF